MPEELDTTESPNKDEALLVEIRENYRAYSEAWREAREHRKKIMRYLSGDPWDEKDKQARADAGRPCVSHDELNQYINQCVNAKRQNKSGIKIEPRGNGANDKTAELRQDIARTVEYRSQAQSIYLKSYQDEVEGGYGFCRVSRRYLNDDTDDQEIVIRPIPNPDSVLYDPTCKEPDWSDAQAAFILEPMSKEDFRREYPDAKVTNFGAEEATVAPEWITDKMVLVAEYWKVVKTKAKGKTGRTVWKKSVVQYITNGIEILQENKQIGEEIPIPAFIGMERYVDEGSGAKRKLFALCSLALDPQMSLAYFDSLEAEEAGLTPKVPYIGYVGQFETDKDAWETASKVPHPMLQADVLVDAANGQTLPLPQRQQFTPNFQAYEVAKESAKRAIQASMGISPLPTQAQRRNEKSGVALDKIQAAQEVGSFHFADGYDRAITRIGRIIDSWIPKVYDTEREMAVHLANDSRKVIMLTPNEPVQTPDGQPDQFRIGDEEHDVTVSVGPSATSQRQVVDEFGDLLVSRLDVLPIPPEAKAKLLGMVIRGKQLGPMGDEMADIISPSDEEQLPPAAQQAIGQAKSELQQLHAYAQQLEGKIQELEQEKAAKVVDNAAKMDIERLKGEIDIAKAEITTKAQSIEERMAFVEDMMKQFHLDAHALEMQAQGHQQAGEMAERGHEQAQESAEQQASLAAQQQEQAAA
jgi:hypothetical protein